jgi:16S rRNA (cytidine1402-2'-O)-methyltransferase
VAGLRSTQFRFVGFMPRVAGETRRLLEQAKSRPETLVAFEAPGRLRKTLALIDEVVPERRLAVCRELTKLHEETFVGTAAQALAHFGAPRGEIVLVIEGGGAEPLVPAGADVADEIGEMKRLGLTRAQAQALIERRFGLGRRRFYELWVSENA